MRAAVVPRLGEVGIQDIPDPVVGDYDALVEILSCGVCTGTDLHILQGEFPWLTPYPFVLGHESIGRVISTGPRVRYLREGDLVLRPMALRAGDHGGGLGTMWGGYAEYGVVADARAIRENAGSDTPPVPQFAGAQQVVPPDFDPVDAGMFITFKETLSWMHQLGSLVNKRVVVLGTGPVGMCFIRIAKFLGANPVIAVGRRSSRLELAIGYGADEAIDTRSDDLVARIRELTGGHGADFIVEGIGNTELMRQSLPALATDGELAVYGVPPALETTFSWAGTAPGWKLRFIKPREEDVHDLALDLVRLGFIDLKSFVSHVLPLSRIDEAMRLVADKQAFKIVVVNEVH